MDIPELPEDFLEKNPNQDSLPSEENSQSPENKEEQQLKDSQPMEGEDQPPKEEQEVKEAPEPKKEETLSSDAKEEPEAKKEQETLAPEAKEEVLAPPEPKKPAKRGRKTSEKEPDKKKAKKETPKAEKKPRRKSEKPQFVKGVPISPMQCESHVPNPYNFDPMAEVMKLGTGQLQSAYRNSRTNVVPPKEKKIYKLEHKGDGDSVESPPVVVEEQEFETPKKPPVAPRKSFMPDFSLLLPPISVPLADPTNPAASHKSSPAAKPSGLLQMAEKISREAEKLNRLNRI